MDVLRIIQSSKWIRTVATHQHYLGGARPHQRPNRFIIIDTYLCLRILCLITGSRLGVRRYANPSFSYLQSERHMLLQICYEVSWQKYASHRIVSSTCINYNLKDNLNLLFNCPDKLTRTRPSERIVVDSEQILLKCSDRDVHFSMSTKVLVLMDRHCLQTF